MEVEIGKGKTARRAYGFDEIAIIPSRRTRNPEDIDITWELGSYKFALPCLASACQVNPVTVKSLSTCFQSSGRGLSRTVFP